MLEGEGWRPELFPDTYDWLYANAFNNIGNIALLCPTCERRREEDKDHEEHVNETWCTAMRQAARSRVLLSYFYNGWAGAYGNSSYAEKLHGPGTRVTGLTQEDYVVCMTFLQEAAQDGDAPGEFVVLPIQGTPRDRAGRFHYHVNLLSTAISACEADHRRCAELRGTWSPARRAARTQS
jgi:hypothetical protein